MVDAACTTNLLLETIMEETSDDLRSETSESDYNSGLLTDSVSTVIHVSSYEKNLHPKGGRGSYWTDRKCSEINDDPGVQDDEEEDDFTDDDDEEDDDNSNDTEDADSDERTNRNMAIDGFPSRTNSLLQFENLEKHYENIFQSPRTGGPLFDLAGAYENKGAVRSWKFKSSSHPENLNNLHDIDDDNDSSSLSSSCTSSSSDMLSSDEMLSSSYSSKYDSLSRKLSLRSFRSIDSLTSLHQKQEKEQDLLHSVDLSQSLNDNLSKIDSQAADEIPTPARGLYKTMECLSEIPNVYCNEVAVTAVAAATIVINEKENKDISLLHHHHQQQQQQQQQQQVKTRSTENLSEDSGFGDHMSKESSSSSSSTLKKICDDDYRDEDVLLTKKNSDVSVSVTEKTPSPTTVAVETLTTSRDGSVDSHDELRGRDESLTPPPPFFTKGGEEQQPDAIYSGSSGEGSSNNNSSNSSSSSNNFSWQSDPNLLNTTFVIRDGVRGDVVPCCDDDDADNVVEPLNQTFVVVEDSSGSGGVTMASRLNVASTPNLYQQSNDEEYHYRGCEAGDRPLADCNDATVSLSRIYSLKRINFASESQLSRAASSKGGNMQIMTSFVNVTNGHQANGGSNKGVHFCPVVSEVNWRESYSSESDDDVAGEPLLHSDAVRRDRRCDEEDECFSSDYELVALSAAAAAATPVRSSPSAKERFNSRSAPAVNTLGNGSDDDDDDDDVVERFEREFSPPLDVLVEKLLSDSVTSKRNNEKELLLRAQQRARLDLITSPPPKRGCGGGPANSGINNNNNNINNKSSSSLNESTSSSSWSSPQQLMRTTTTSTSYHSAAFAINAMDSSGAGDNNYVSGGGVRKGKAGTAAAASSTTTTTTPTKSSPVGKLGGFFQRFSLKRLSGRKSKKKAASANASAATVAPPVVVGVVPKIGGSGGGSSDGIGGVSAESNSRIIPLSGDYNGDDGGYSSGGGGGGAEHHYYRDDDEEYGAGGSVVQEVVSSKPPLPPFVAPARRRPSGDASTVVDSAPQRASAQSSSSFSEPLRHHQQQQQQPPQQYSQQYGVDLHTPSMLRKTTAACIDRPSPSSSPHHRATTGFGLLETDIDSNVTSSTSNVSNDNNNSQYASSPSSKKSRSLLNLDNGRMSLLSSSPSPSSTKASLGAADKMKTSASSPHHNCNDYRAKSMEFLLDKENQAAIKAPENELQKGNGERKMSEHELRVQRSLQKLNVPEWYKNSAVPTQGFLLKRHSDVGQSVPQHQRWNTNTLPSKTTSLSSLGPNLSIAPRSPTSSSVTSPGPTHYSFSRWSTSRLNSGTNSSNTSPCGSARSSFNYRQPYLGWRSQEKLSKPRTPAERLAAGLLPQRNQNGSQQSSPSLTEVRSSIKEVTSAIVHYVSGTRDSSDRLSPSLRYYADSSSRSTSPRGSTGRLCWLESSFVGSKPSNAPETPSTVTDNKMMQSTMPQDRTVVASTTAAESYSNYSATNNNNNSQKCCDNQTYNNRINEGANVPRSSCLKSVSQCPCKTQSNPGESIEAPTNRVLVESSNKKPQQLNVRLVVQCKYPKCGKFAEPAEAKRTFKVCHNCDYIYCSRECRHDHWEKHRKACLQSRISELCHRLLNAIKTDPNLSLVASRVARRSFLECGRGCVKYYFHSPQIADQFANGNTAFPEASYVRWSDLEPTEMGNELHSAIVRVCKSYNPDTRLVVLVAVHVVSEVPSIGSVKWERQIIFRYSKTKLSADLVSRDPSLFTVNRLASEYPQTLILTSVPGAQRTQKEREVNFTNIQRQLRQRGVSLRKQFPDVYKLLCDYVEGSATFTPTTIYPVDAASGKTFMCVIMPDAEPEKLDLIPKENSVVQTVDISQSTASSSSDN